MKQRSMSVSRYDFEKDRLQFIINIVLGIIATLFVALEFWQTVIISGDYTKYELSIILIIIIGGVSFFVFVIRPYNKWEKYWKKIK